MWIGLSAQNLTDERSPPSMFSFLEYDNGELTLNSAPKLYEVKSTRTIEKKAPPKGGQRFVFNDFMTSLRRGGHAKTDVRDNIHSVAMVFAAVKAAKTGRVIPILDASIEKLLKNA